jgi:hypothetical protein
MTRGQTIAQAYAMHGCGTTFSVLAVQQIGVMTLLAGV